VSDIIERGIAAGEPKNRTPASEGTLARIANTLKSDRESNLLVSSLRSAWRDDFNGAALNPDTWQIVRNNPGQTISLAGGELTIGAGTVASEETIIRSLVPLSIPFRVWFIGRLSQRIANQEIFMEVVNAVGDMAASWKLDATTATNGKYIATNGGNGALSAAVTIATTASDSIIEIELAPDEAWFSSRLADSRVAKSGNWCLSRNIPDPNDTYYVQIRVVNLGVAPASNTNLILGAVAVQDINELTAEITGGRGDTGSAKAVPVQVTNTPAVTSTSTMLAHSTTTGDSTHSHTVSAASNNATSVKASAGSIGSIVACNNSAGWRYLKIYNKASAPAPATDVPIRTIGIPPGGTVDMQHAIGLRCSLGIAIAIVAGIAANDNTAIGANEVAVSIAHV